MITLTLTRDELEELILGNSHRMVRWLRHCRRGRERRGPMERLRLLDDKLMEAWDADDTL